MEGYSGGAAVAGNDWPVQLQVCGQAGCRLTGKKMFINEVPGRILHYHTRAHAQTKSLMSVVQPAHPVYIMMNNG
jgi:hypothetical protein